MYMYVCVRIYHVHTCVYTYICVTGSRVPHIIHPPTDPPNQPQTPHNPPRKTGLISIDLAKRLLESHPQGARALVVSTENLTQAFYHGNDRAFLLQNTLFRCGGAAVLLSNKARDGLRAKFKLLHVVRTQGTDRFAYDAVYSTQDSKGEKGVRLSKDIVKVAGRLMEKNLTAIGCVCCTVWVVGFGGICVPVCTDAKPDHPSPLPQHPHKNHSTPTNPPPQQPKRNHINTPTKIQHPHVQHKNTPGPRSSPSRRCPRSSSRSPRAP